VCGCVNEMLETLKPEYAEPSAASTWTR
jgi:hypothetical protein